MGPVGMLNVRRQSVPPSPEKMAASPRLFLKLQHKKSSASSSSASDEQQRVSEWNVLTVDPGCEVNSEGESGSRTLYVRSGLSTTARPSKPDDNWSRMSGQTSGVHGIRTGDGDGCPDSTVAVSVPLSLSSNPLERIATEPFTPRGLEPGGSSDNEEEHSDVFSTLSSNMKTSNTFNTSCSTLGTSNEIIKQQPLPPPLPSQQQQLQQRPFQSLQQQHHFHQQHQHIPGQTISTYHSVRHSLKLPNMVQTLSSSSFGSEQSGVSSSMSSSSSSSSHHSNNSSSCQFPLVSSSSSLPSSTSSSSQALCPGLPSHHQLHPSHTLQSCSAMSTPSSTSHLQDPRPGTISSSLPFPPYPPRGAKGGGSIVTGLSDRAMAASGAAVSSISSIPSTALVPSPHLPWETARMSISHLEEKSDSSSCDSPLRVDLEDSNPTLSEQGSRPTTPKVPPLKIIIPPKAGGPSANISKPLTKPALPYILNPTTENESWDAADESGQRTLPSSSLSAVQEIADYSNSRPVSRAGSGIGVSSSELASKPPDSVVTLARNLDIDEAASRESDMRAEHTDGSGEKSDEGKEKRPTRTLRSHTAMLQQQQQKDKVTDKDKNGKCFLRLYIVIHLLFVITVNVPLYAVV